jgi:hypothetical protein
MSNRSCVVRLRIEPGAALAASVLLCLAAPAVRAAAAVPPEAAIPSIAQVDAARQAVAADPNLGTERMVRTLRWIEDDEPAARQRSGFLAWMADLLAWIARSARLLVWVLCAVLAAIVVVYVLRLVTQRQRARSPVQASAPTHVRDLDIRPESLPDDIGAAARRLWDSGEPRRALALLYRGLLSRLAHAHQAPVRDSTTEGESIALAQRFLPAGGGEFAAGLVRTWQRAVYGGDMPQTALVHGLCAQFAPALDASPPAAQAAAP